MHGTLPPSYVRIPSAALASARYEDAPFLYFCQRAGIPTGETIPRRVFDLACQAFDLRAIEYVPFDVGPAYLAAVRDAEVRRKTAQTAALDEARAILADRVSV